MSIIIFMTPERYNEIVDTLNREDLRISLSRDPTVLGPGYISETIAKILDAKAFVNDLAKEVEFALTKAQVFYNNTEEEINARTDLALNYIAQKAPRTFVGLDAKGKSAKVREYVGQQYQADFRRRQPQDPLPKQFALWDHLLQAENAIVELKALSKILDHRREEYVKLDSGVRLQQRTVQAEIDLYKKGGPSTLVPENGRKDHAPSDPIYLYGPDETEDEEFVNQPENPVQEEIAESGENLTEEVRIYPSEEENDSTGD